MTTLRLLMIPLVACCALAARPADDTSNRVIDQKTKSVKIALVDNDYFPPIYVMGSNKFLKVTFDYMDYDRQWLRYSIQHCDASWQPSQLVESEYVDGFNEGQIEDYEHCEGTWVHYCNYSFTLPNDNFQITKSGNYLLKVWREGDPDDVLFQARFAVCENTVGVYGQVLTNTDVDYNAAHQQLNFDVVARQGQIADPYNEITAIVTQNERDDNQAVVSKPLMVADGKITYEHNRDLIFEAGNEYRRMEIVSTTAMNMRVASMEYHEPFYHAVLYVDEPRAQQQYLYDKTQYGRFTVRNADTDFERASTEADYIMTHFVLKCDKPLAKGEIHIQGEFTKGLPSSATLMTWNDQYECYTCDMLLKQGAYNYQYLWFPEGSSKGSTALVEGNKYQTCNEYVVRIYDRPFGERYDHLVGFGIINSAR